MMRRIAVLLAAFCFVLSAGAQTQLFSGAGQSTYSPTTNIWFGDPTSAVANAVLIPTLNAGIPGVGIVTDLNTPPQYATQINATGAKTMVGLGAYAAAWAQGYDPNGWTTCSGCWAGLQSTIATAISDGATWFFVDEPNDGSPTSSDTCSAASISFDVTGFNMIYAYIKGLNPNAMLGIVQNGYGKSSCTPNDAIGWHEMHLAAGMHEDFAAEEVYNQICCGAQTTSPWVTDGWTYTGVKKMELVYSVATLCALQYINYSNIDLVAFWDSDLYGNFIGPTMDPTQLPAALHFAATQDKTLYCNQNYSQDSLPTWDTQFGPSFTRTIFDNTSYGNWTSPYTISSCDYTVYSGANAVNRLYDPSVVQTRSWTSRTCNSTITIAVGSSGDCRDEVSDPITATISGTTLNVTAGTFTQPLQLNTGILGSGVTAGTYITALGSGAGGTGTYTVNNSQTSSPTAAALGVKTCLVEVRAHNNSPGGLGNPTYQEFSIAY